MKPGDAIGWAILGVFGFLLGSILTLLPLIVQIFWSLGWGNGVSSAASILGMFVILPLLLHFAIQWLIRTVARGTGKETEDVVSASGSERLIKRFGGGVFFLAGVALGTLFAFLGV